MAELQRSVETYLAQCHDNYNMSGICEVNNLLIAQAVLLCNCHCVLQDVMSQICSTLFDYPSIRQCAQLQTFIRKCVTTAWSLVSQVNIVMVIIVIMDIMIVMIVMVSDIMGNIL